MKIRVGIFFGGPSRERESSFIGGRMLYDNLDQSLFEPVPIFVDSFRQFILLDWRHLHKNAIRAFYPPVSYRPASANDFPIYIESLGRLPADEQDLILRKIGRKLPAGQLAGEIDLAFIALPSEWGEEGVLQRLLEAQGIPYTGAGPEAAQTCLDEALEKKWLAERGYNTPIGAVIQREKYGEQSAVTYYDAAVKQLGFPLTVRPAHCTGGIGLSVVREEEGLEGFARAMNKAFFRRQLTLGEWEDYEPGQKLTFIQAQTDLQTGLGFPIDIYFQGHVSTVYHPERLLAYLNGVEGERNETIILESRLRETKVIVEKTIMGRSFSCLVVGREGGSAVALLPMINASRDDGSPAGAPLDASEEQLRHIREKCEQLFAELNLQTFAQIDGLLAADGRIYWTNIDVTPGFSPGDALYHQGAVIGLTPSQFLTYLVSISLESRSKDPLLAERSRALIERLETQLDAVQTSGGGKKRIAVLVGGDAPREKQRSLESGRNIFEKLDASEKYAPFPVYVSAAGAAFRFYLFSPSLLLLQDAETLRSRIDDHRPYPELENIRVLCAAITGKYAHEIMMTGVQETNLRQLKSLADAVFITPIGPARGLPAALEELEIPCAGANALTDNMLTARGRVLEILSKNGVKTPDQLTASKRAYEADAADLFNRIESRFSYPLTAQPNSAEGESAARLIGNRLELEAYVRLLFRPEGQQGAEARRLLRVDPDAVFPRHDQLLIETAFIPAGSRPLVRVKAGLITTYGANGEIQYEVFEPTEILSGETPNLTPARLGDNAQEQERVVRQVQSVIERAARVLNIQGTAVIEAVVNRRPDGGVETAVTRVDPAPDLDTGGDFLQQAALAHYPPVRLFDQMLNFALRRQAIERGVPATDRSKQEKDTNNKIMEDRPETSSTSNGNNRAKWPATPEIFRVNDPDTGLWAAVKSRARVFFAELWRFVKTPIFIRNVGGLFLFLFALLWIFQLWLRLYTHHEQSLQVDDYTGMRIEDAMRQAKRSSFSVVVMDSFFLVDRPAGIVLEQDPKPFTRVKENRTIYLIVTKRTPDEVVLPGLVGNYDYFQYARKLQRLNVRAKIREKEFSSKLEENTILYLYVEGEKITEDDLKRGVKVPMGSVVEFVITQRNTGMVSVPNLVCMKYDEAVFLITSMNLNIGRIYGEVADRENAYVYKQEPDYSPGDNISMGTAIDIYLTINRPSGCDE